MKYASANKFPKNFWADVVEIDELIYTLENVSNDLKRPLESFSVAEVVEEAEYVLSTFFEAGHYNGDAYSGEFEDGQYTQKWARGEVRKLRALIRKHKTTDTPYTHMLPASERVAAKVAA
jgi:hypothetical protein